MNTKIRFGSLAMMLIVAVVGTTSSVWADQQVQLKARQNRQINGFQAELRGDYREKSGPDRLNAELDKINVPLRTPVAFCLIHNGVSSLIGVARVSQSGGSMDAQIELEAQNGDSVPKVDAGDLLQAHQHNRAPFNPNPTCVDLLLLSAPFQK
jgi:hypothetical protein